MLIQSCANVVPPSGGKKDTQGPKLLSISPADSQLNARVSRIELRFNEFIDVRNASSEVQVSPLLPIPLNVTFAGKKVIVKIPDTLLQDRTTYRISFNSAIVDLHESNPFKAFTYTFSTTNYFDSLGIRGQVINAATGFPDSAFILLYEGRLSDSVVVREKPSYVGKCDAGGNFHIAGLPDKEFHIYALKDANTNLIYDGGEEAIGFTELKVRPSTDTGIKQVVLRTFIEKALPDTSTTAVEATSGKTQTRKERRASEKDGFVYTVFADTSDTRKRSYDLTKPVNISFNKDIDTFNKARVFVSYDSAEIAIETDFTLERDTSDAGLQLNTAWKENTLYTVRLLKGFAKDTGGVEAMPSRYTFRTKSEDDYSKLTVHLPAKYSGADYVLRVMHDADSIYQKVVTDTMVRLRRLQPGNYSMRIIVDKNHNVVWDTGELFERIQPEEVIPFKDPLTLKAGWDNTIDFEKVETTTGKKGSSPNKRDKP